MKEKLKQFIQDLVQRKNDLQIMIDKTPSAEFSLKLYQKKDEVTNICLKLAELYSDEYKENPLWQN